MNAADYDAALLRHAHLFGTEGVLDVMSPGVRRSRLQVELDAIDASRPRRRFEDAPKRRRRKPVETIAIVATLRAEGLVPSAIANKLGLSDQYVRKCLKQAGKPAWLSGKSGTETEGKGIAHA